MNELNGLSLLYVILSYSLLSIFILAFSIKLIRYALTPSPLKIPISPQPKTTTMVIVTFLTKMVTFSPLWKADRRLWAGGWFFHLALLYLLIHHLRYFTEPVSDIVSLLAPYADYLAAVLVISLLALASLKVTVKRYSYISSKADYAILLLFLFITITGIALKANSPEQFIYAREFLLGLKTFSPVNIPEHPLFLLHYTSALLLLFIIPFSKLLHSGSVFFSPTLLQTDKK